MEQLLNQHLRLLSHLNMPFERSLMNKINWNSRLIGIRGARGVAKPTKILQYPTKTHGNPLNTALHAMGE